MSRLSIMSVSLLAVLSSAALAQAPQAKDGPGNNAVNSEQKNSNVPVAGRNSFTEGQAKNAIEKAGYTGVSDLKKDENGVWRGKAIKGGASRAVSIDFQGNVNAGK